MSRSWPNSPRRRSASPTLFRANPTPAQAAAVPAAAAGSNTSGGIDTQLLAQLVSTSVQAALTAQAAAAPPPAPPAPPVAPAIASTSRYIKASDLPTFKGYSLDGADATSFIDKLETQFRLAGTLESEKTEYASLAFPEDSPANSWYREQRDLGLFRERFDPPDVLRYKFFRQAFLQRFSTPIARRYALEDTWDKFTQKETVTEHHIKFTKLWHKLQQLGIVIAANVVASKYLRSLKPELFHAVCQKNVNLPDLDTVHRQAVEAEYQLKPSSSRPAPQFNYIPPPNQGNQGGDTQKDRSKERTGDKWCTWHKWNNSHTTKDCKKIKELKDKGEWKGKD